MSLLVVCPVILPPRDGLIESWDHRPHLLVVNGDHERWVDVCGDERLLSVRPGYNAGCPWAWNVGFEYAREAGLAYVAIMSQSLVLTDGTRHLAELVDEHADDRGLATGYSFHCVVLSVALWRRVGPFDETLPVWCDIDFLRRAFLAGELATPLPVVNVRGDTSRCAALKAGAVPSGLYDDDERRYVAKWGGEAGAETYTRPWDESSVATGVATPGLKVRLGTPGVGSVDRQVVGATVSCHEAPLPGVRWFTPPHSVALTDDECDMMLTDIDGWLPSGYATTVAASGLATRARFAAAVMLVVPDHGVIWSNAQVLDYRPGDSFGWHTDRNPVPGYDTIVFSAIAQLSDPSDYEGGSVEFREDGQVVTLPRARGTVVVFHATVEHRVLPITAGTRFSVTSFHRDRPLASAEGSAALSAVTPGTQLARQRREMQRTVDRLAGSL